MRPEHQQDSVGISYDGCGSRHFYLPPSIAYTERCPGSSWTSTDGLAIDYLWREMLTWRSLTDILVSYAQVVETKARRAGTGGPRSGCATTSSTCRTGSKLLGGSDEAESK